MPSINPLGHSALGQPRLGDELATNVRPLSNAVLVSYTVSASQYAAAVPVTYTLQGRARNAILAYYLIGSAGAFAINGDATIISPDQVTYTPRAVVNRTLLGSPTLQGFSQMVWTYSVLQIAEFSQIIAYYNPQNPLVTLTFPDETGLWRQQQVVMLPPQYGTQTTVIVNNVQLTFIRLT